MKKILFGSTGLLGSDFLANFPDLYPVPRQVDLTNEKDITTLFHNLKPTLVINCAAYANVDKCEDNPELNWNINAVAPGLLAELCKVYKAKLVHFSTDYVFDSMVHRPWGEDDKTNAPNEYGKAKAEGETRVRGALNEHYIFRVSTLYGKGRKVHLQWLLDAIRGDGRPRIANDMVGSPSYTKTLALKTKECLDRGIPYGTYNFVTSGYCTREEFAREVFRLLRKDPNCVDYGSIKDLKLKAVRPGNPLLSMSKLQEAGILFPTWKEDLVMCLEDFGYLKGGNL